MQHEHDRRNEAMTHLGPTEPHGARMPYLDVTIGVDRTSCPRCLRQWTAHSKAQAQECVRAGVAYADSIEALMSDDVGDVQYVIDTEVSYGGGEQLVTVPVPATATRAEMVQVLTGHIADIEARYDDATRRRYMALRDFAGRVNPRDPIVVPPPCLPAEMPDVRLKLLAGWETRGWHLLAQHAVERLGMMVEHSQAPEAADVSVAWEKQALRRADLWWVGEEMCDLLFATMAKVPGDVMIENLTWPSDTGLVVFAKPWRCIDAVTAHHEIRVHAVAWGASRLPPGMGGVDGRECLSLSSYQLLDFDAGLSPDELRLATESDAIERGRRSRIISDADGNMTFALHGREWVPLGRSDWSFEAPLDNPLVSVSELVRRRDMLMPGMPALDEDGAQAFADSTVEDRRMIAALWTLLDTRSVAQQVDAPVPRQARRRSDRAGVPPSKVKIVYLRRPEHPDGEHTEHDDKGVRWSHRWMVSAHMRNQPYGPGRKYRKLIMIPPHVKGPSDKELLVKDTVKVWVR